MLFGDFGDFFFACFFCLFSRINLSHVLVVLCYKVVVAEIYSAVCAVAVNFNVLYCCKVFFGDASGIFAESVAESSCEILVFKESGFCHFSGKYYIKNCRRNNEYCDEKSDETAALLLLGTG